MTIPATLCQSYQYPQISVKVLKQSVVEHLLTNQSDFTHNILGIAYEVSIQYRSSAFRTRRIGNRLGTAYIDLLALRQ